MAVTKIKPIRGTVNKALAYILDPKKTDDELYVSSYGCAASDAAAKEFEWTRNLAVQQGMQMLYSPCAPSRPVFTSPLLVRT